MLPGIKQFDLTGRVAIVTGGSKGLGQAMAAGLASAGADVLLVSRNRDEAEAAATGIASDHGQGAVGFRSAGWMGLSGAAPPEQPASQLEGLSSRGRAPFAAEVWLV